MLFDKNNFLQKIMMSNFNHIKDIILSNKVKVDARRQHPGTGLSNFESIENESSEIQQTLNRYFSNIQVYEFPAINNTENCN